MAVLTRFEHFGQTGPRPAKLHFFRFCGPHHDHNPGTLLPTHSLFVSYRSQSRTLLPQTVQTKRPVCISRWQLSLRGNRLPCMRHECTYDTSGGLVTRADRACRRAKDTAKMAKNATLLTFTGPSFGLFALFEVTEFGSETDTTQRGCALSMSWWRCGIMS